MMKTMRKQALPLILAVVALLLVFGAVKAEAMADNVISVSTEAELKAKWYREPGTGYTGLTHNSKGELVVFRHSWW